MLVNQPGHPFQSTSVDYYSNAPHHPVAQAHPEAFREVPGHQPFPAPSASGLLSASSIDNYLSTPDCQTTGSVSLTTPNSHEFDLERTNWLQPIRSNSSLLQLHGAPGAMAPGLQQEDPCASHLIQHSAHSDFGEYSLLKLNDSTDSKLTIPLHQSTAVPPVGNSICALLRSSDTPWCAGCDCQIWDKYLLELAGRLWHEDCLRCTVCSVPLKTTTYVKDSKPYCATDYCRHFSTCCNECHQPISPTDMVHRCSSTLIYHSVCFRCFCCKRPLLKGEQFVMYQDKAVCVQDYKLMLNYQQQPQQEALLGPPTGRSRHKIPKRPRTILTTSQRRSFKDSFEKSAKPCRKVRESLARETGLSVRVVQVWFQNQRAKMKKGKSKGMDGHPVNEQTDDDCDGRTSRSSQGITNQTSLANSPVSLVDNDDLESHGTNDSDDSSHSNPMDKLYLMQDNYFN